MSFYFSGVSTTTIQPKVRNTNIHLTTAVIIGVLVGVVVLFGAIAIVSAHSSVLREQFNIRHSTRPSNQMHWRKDNFHKSFENSFTGSYQNGYRFYNHRIHNNFIGEIT